MSIIVEPTKTVECERTEVLVPGLVITISSCDGKSAIEVRPTFGTTSVITEIVEGPGGLCVTLDPQSDGGL